ncbi:phage portal protein [Elstera cyanobacteriorum]|uniref:phage portal protein n=1 Tax=Elstera cyanobacteriorum TaxID=2022747 RepID=UPI0023522E81|nr:phage portal protein [Elstera cyanobacteriorum]MCK6444407.1 phage portal protein [Elstera cyanobacteriorum]
MFSLAKLFPRLEKRSGFNELERFLLSANNTSAGIAVSPENALRCPIVLGCVRVIADSVSQLPLILYRRRENGEKERATDHPLYSLLHDSPNDWTGSAEFRASMMTCALLNGDAFAFIGRANGRVFELIQSPSRSISVDVDDAGEPFFVASMKNGNRRIIDRKDVFRLKVPGPDPVRGLSLVEQAKDSIGLALALEGYASRMFSKGARPSGVVKAPGKLTDSAVSRLRASLQSLHSGGESGGTAIFEEGMTFEPLQFTSVDMQYIELFRHQIAQIARVFRVPLHMIQELERTTHSNAEAMGQEFLSTVLLPWLKLWEQAISRDLLEAEERSEYFAEFLVDDLVKADLASRMAAYATAITNSILTPNECRAMENRSPLPGGDDLRAPLNTSQVAANG